MATVLEQERQTAVLAVLGLPDPETLSSPKEAYDAYRRYETVKNILEAYYKVLRDQLFALANEAGESDENGSMVVRFPDGTGFKKERRVSVTFNPDRIAELLRRKGLWHRVPRRFECQTPEALRAILDAASAHEVEVVEIGDAEALRDALEAVYIDGSISDDELSSCVERKESWALVDLSKRRR